MTTLSTPDLDPIRSAMDNASPVIDLDHMQPASVKVRRDRTRQVHLLRKETATQAIEGLEPGVDLFGLTAGQFSLVELLDAILGVTGPAKRTLSTWTAARADADKVLEFLRSGRATSARFLLDVSFRQRQPGIAKVMQETFGKDSIRVCRNHSKFALAEADGWTLTLKTSMNLNRNARLEDFDLTTDPELFHFLDDYVTQMFKKAGGRR